MKHSLLLVICLLPISFAFAQRQNVYFLKTDGRLVSTQDSADYIRVVKEPDSGSVLYNIEEYYLNHKPKLIGKSTEIFPSYLMGDCISYYPTGKRQSILHYTRNHPTGKQYFFYPNGKPYKTLICPDTVEYRSSIMDTSYIIDNVTDSLGAPMIINGNGHYKGYNEKFKSVIEEGDVIKGKRNGVWKGIDEHLKITYTENYVNGKLIKGSSVSEKRDTVYYNDAGLVPPHYKNGSYNFYMELAKTIRYPLNARLNNIQGTVALSFYVEEDGSLSNIKVVQSVNPELDAEAVRSLKALGNWVPCTIRGRKVRKYETIPITYTIR